MPIDPDPIRRRKTHGAGQLAESVAALWLVLRGYRILARRFRVHGGELDIVARRGDVLAIVEVKARPTIDMARVAVTPAKLRRIERATAVWISRHAWSASLVVRGDILAIAPWSRPCHMLGALSLRI